MAKKALAGKLADKIMPGIEDKVKKKILSSGAVTLLIIIGLLLYRFVIHTLLGHL